MVAAVIQSWTGTNKAANNNVPPTTAGYYRAGYSYLMVIVFDNLTATTPTLNTASTFKPTDATWELVTSFNSPQATAAAGVRGEVWLLRVPPTSLGATWSANAGGATLNAAVTAKALIIVEVKEIGTVASAQSSNTSVTSPGLPGAGYLWLIAYGSESAVSLNGTTANAFTTGANAQTNATLGVSAGVSSGASPGGSYPVASGTVDGGISFIIFNPEVTGPNLDVSGQIDVVSDTSADITTNAPAVPVEVSGTVDVVSASSADVNIRHAVSGTVYVVSVSSGDVNVNHAVSGTVAVVSVSSGDITTIQSVSGTVDVISVSSGTVDNVHLVSGTVAVVSDSTADVTVNVSAPQDISGTVDVVSGSSADITVNLAAPQAVSGMVDVVSASSGAVTNSHPISGTVDVVSVSSGAVTNIHPVSGTVDVVSVSSGAVTNIHPVSGTVDVVSSSSADVTAVAPGQVSGTVVVVSTTSGNITTIVPVSGTVSVVSDTSANATTVVTVSGSVAVVSATSANITIGVPSSVSVSGTVNVDSQTSGNITVDLPGNLQISGTVNVYSTTYLALASSITSRIEWDKFTDRFFETGVDRGVLYLADGRGVVWNGLVSVNETPTGGDVGENYIDGQKFVTRRRPESFAATIEAYNYPMEFEPYVGQIGFRSAQRRQQFGFSYRTLVGDFESGTSFSYKIHLVYNASVAPSKNDYQSLTDSSDAFLFNWEVSTVPIKMGDRSSAHLIIDPNATYPWLIEELERRLYGSTDKEPYLPPPEEILDLFEDASILRITDHGDGTWTADGPDSAIIMLTSTMFEITWPSAVYIDDVTYKISSL